MFLSKNGEKLLMVDFDGENTMIGIMCNVYR